MCVSCETRFAVWDNGRGRRLVDAVAPCCVLNVLLKMKISVLVCLMDLHPQVLSHGAEVLERVLTLQLVHDALGSFWIVTAAG